VTIVEKEKVRKKKRGLLFNLFFKEDRKKRPGLNVGKEAGKGTRCRCKGRIGHFKERTVAEEGNLKNGEERSEKGEGEAYLLKKKEKDTHWVLGEYRTS